jgi:hypothetical protein
MNWKNNNIEVFHNARQAEHYQKSIQNLFIKDDLG